MTMKVRPRAAVAPALIRVEVRIAANPANRRLRVVAESLDFSRSSEIQVDGAAGPPLRTFNYPDVPGGNYEVSATLIGATGTRAVATQQVQVVADRAPDR
jgi:hypothetical protein